MLSGYKRWDRGTNPLRGLPSLYERGMGQQYHFVHCCPSGYPPLCERLTPLYERGIGQSPRGARPLPSRLRPMAVILDCVWFALLTRSQSNPLRGFGVSLIETKTRLCSLVFVSRRERDSNPRTCDSLRISRPAQSTTLASLQGSHNLVKI